MGKPARNDLSQVSMKFTLRARYDQTESHRALISLILEHDLVRKVCNFSGSCSNSHQVREATPPGASRTGSTSPEFAVATAAAKDGQDARAPRKSHARHQMDSRKSGGIRSRPQATLAPAGSSQADCH